jgi:methyl-accepting chemotaxis protein
VPNRSRIELKPFEERLGFLMGWFTDLTIKTKITLSFTVIGVLTGILAYQGIQYADPASRYIPVILTLCAILLYAGLGILLHASIVKPLRTISEFVKKAASGEINGQIDISTRDEIGEITDSLKQIAQNHREMARVAMRISKGDFNVQITPAGDKDLLGKGMQLCIKNIQSFDDELIRLVDAAKNGNLAERARVDSFQGAYSILVRGINEMLDTLIRPVSRAIRVMDQVGKRDLTARLVGQYRGDFAGLQSSLNLTVHTLDQALGQVALAAEQVSSASAQISTGSQVLSRGSSDQAASIQEVSSTLEEVESVTRQTTEHAREARDLSKAAETAAEMGVDSMNRLSDAIGRIKASSDSTARIIRTIDEIAFQTNLLALNAAVEAARAGDAGKGFAVVAEEVRNLALRSAEAAGNTATLIEQSVRNSESGVALNREVLKNLHDINEQVKRVGSVMAEIAAASEQQNQGVTQVNNVIHQMNTITQQIAANAEESAIGAEELSGQADELKNMVFAFRLSSGAPSARPAAGPSVTRGPGQAMRKKGGGICGLKASAGVARHPAIPDASSMIPFGDLEQPVLGKYRT